MGDTHPLKDVFGDTSATGLTSKKSGMMYCSANREYTADPGSIVSKFQSVDASEDTFGFGLPELELPGFGEEYDDCGEEIPRFCSDCGATHTVGRTCYRSECPRCGAAWTRRQGTAIASKLEAVRRYLESKESGGWSGYKFHHLSLSPPEGYETFTKESLDRTFEILKEVLDELGVRTGAMLYHPWSGSGEGDDLGEWKGRLFNDREWSDVLEELEHRPHFHVVCVAKHVDGGYVTKAIHEQTGWIVERITKGEDSDVSIYDKYDLCRVVSYCLSHTGLRETESGRTQAAYRYFGRVANFEAADHIEAEMDAAMRSVAPRTLDLDWSSLACQKDRGDRDPQGWLAISPEQAAAGDPQGLRMGDGEESQPSPPDDTCAGRMLHLSRAPEYLEDDEWCELAPRSDELAETWDDWKDEIEEPPPTD